MKNKKLEEELKDSKESVVEKPGLVDDTDLEEITEHVELKAFIEDDEVMGKHIILYVNRGEKENAVGLSVHPTVSKRLLNRLKKDGILK